MLPVPHVPLTDAGAGTLQFTVCGTAPTTECLQDHCHLPLPTVTPGGLTKTLPAPHKFADGCVLVTTPFAAEPHDATGAMRAAEQLGLAPPFTPKHFQFTVLADPYFPAGNATVAGDAVPTVHNGVEGPEAVYA